MYGSLNYEGNNQLALAKGHKYVERRRAIMHQLREAKAHLWGAARDAEEIGWEDFAKHVDDVYKLAEGLHLSLREKDPEEKPEMKRKRLERAPGAVRSLASGCYPNPNPLTR